MVKIVEYVKGKIDELISIELFFSKSIYLKKHCRDWSRWSRSWSPSLYSFGSGSCSATLIIDQQLHPFPNFIRIFLA
jgi:hypothetical protein